MRLIQRPLTRRSFLGGAAALPVCWSWTSAEETPPPSVLYRRYESIRTRRPVAIARTTDGTCQGCHLGVPPMMFQKLRRQQEFEQCPHCRRILYYWAPEAS